MNTFLQKIKNLVPSRRKIIQLYSALLFNANIKGFFNGRIYKGPLKNVCTPGLNCYSCPGASGACPLGSLQNALSDSGRTAPYYVLGILLLYGVIFGRFICGFLCPFGLIQELLHKIKTPKLKKGRITRILSYLKYMILVLFVVIVPLAYMFRDFPLPGFCKYICPAGTLEGAIGLLSNAVNESELARLGPIFTWKFALLVSCIVACVFIFRAFCRFICPLGAIYGFFNKISVLGIKLDRPKCIDCGLCISKCKMDIRHVGDHECISCGECISVCPTKAISFKGSKIILPENEITPVTSNMSDDERAAVEAKNAETQARAEKRRMVLRIVTASVMTLLLVGAIVYFNFIDKNETVAPPDGSGDVEYGNEVGDLCYGVDITLFDENGELGTTFNPAKNHGKVTVINFWGTWCGPCKAELPYFDRIAEEYSESVTVLAIHTVYTYENAPEYVATNYPDSKILFGVDTASGSGDYYFKLLGGGDSYPITIVLDENGVIVETVFDSLTYEDLKDIVDSALAD